MMLTALEIPVFFHNDEILDLKVCDIDYSLSRCDRRLFYFYHINGLTIYKDELDNDREYCSVHTNDSEYISPLNITQVREKLEKHLLDSLFFLKT